jgi:DUF1365 family protein
MNSCLYKTTIIHERFHGLKHKFEYSVLNMYIDHDEVNEIKKNIKFFSYNTFNIFSYYEKDHGYRDGRSLRMFVEDFFKLKNIIFDDLKIKIFCFPRILGYVFNPLSIIYCYNNNELLSIFYEVKNTSGEQHTYCFAGSKNNLSHVFQHECNKNFYVSPFIGMKALYKFKNYIPKDRMSIIIDLLDSNNRKILRASQSGTKIQLNTFTLVKQLIINPFIAIKIIFLIMYESFFILLKGGKYYARQKKIIDSVSFEGKL